MNFNVRSCFIDFHSRTFLPCGKRLCAVINFFNPFFLGDTICVIRGRKGTYIRTSQGRIFAVRLNDTSRFTSAQSEPATQLSQASAVVSRSVFSEWLVHWAVKLVRGFVAQLGHLSRCIHFINIKT